MSNKRCLYCGKPRKLDAKLTCNECRERQSIDDYKGAVWAMFHGTGEDEDAFAERIADDLDESLFGIPRRRHYTRPHSDNTV